MKYAYSTEIKKLYKLEDAISKQPSTTARACAVYYELAGREAGAEDYKLVKDSPEEKEYVSFMNHRCVDPKEARAVRILMDMGYYAEVFILRTAELVYIEVTGMTVIVVTSAKVLLSKLQKNLKTDPVMEKRRKEEMRKVAERAGMREV